MFVFLKNSKKIHKDVCHQGSHWAFHDNSFIVVSGPDPHAWRLLFYYDIQQVKQEKGGGIFLSSLLRTFAIILCASSGGILVYSDCISLVIIIASSLIFSPSITFVKCLVSLIHDSTFWLEGLQKEIHILSKWISKSLYSGDDWPARCVCVCPFYEF